MEAENSLKLSADLELEGNNPVVIVGPNGSGKTRYGAELSDRNNGDLIGALRQIALAPSVTLPPIQQSRNNLESVLRNRRSRPWEMSSEIEHLFAKLLVEDYSAAIRFRRQYSEPGSAVPEQTKLMTLSELWNRLFPGREISFEENEPKVKSSLANQSVEYPAQQMSDGERVALYLAGRVLDSTSQFIIVDEPEVHFHSRLAVRFWNELEDLRPDCRFIYITHDLPFALSRQSATYIMVRPEAELEILSLEDGLALELAEYLLAAASFSIYASRVVFCEGASGRSVDEALYGSWFSASDTAVVPVEKSEEVFRCVSAFGRKELVAGVEAIGIVDRDYWPDEFLVSLPENVFVLPFHEVENLFCLRGVYLAVAKHLSISEADANTKYDEFIAASRELFVGSLLNKQISERFKLRCEHEFQLASNALSIDEDMDMTRD